MKKRYSALLAFVLLYMQSPLNGAAGETPMVLSAPGDRGHEKLRQDCKVSSSAVVAKIPSQAFFEKVVEGEASNDFSGLLAYLQAARGDNPDSPYVPVVMPAPVRFGRGRTELAGPSVAYPMFPIRAAFRNSKGCYLGAAYAIAQRFPDAVDRDALESYLSLKLQIKPTDFFYSEDCAKPEEVLSDDLRAFLDIFIPHLSDPTFNIPSPFIDAKEPVNVVALYARGARFDKTAYKDSEMHFEFHKLSKAQLATFELIAQEDEKLKEILPNLREHQIGHRYDTSEVSEDLAEKVAFWLKEEREYLQSKGFKIVS